MHNSTSESSKTRPAIPWKLIGTIAISVPVGFALLKVFGAVGLQNRIIYLNYFPPGSRGKLQLNPSTFGLPSYEDIRLTTCDNKLLHAWYIRNETNVFSRAPTLLYLHGNAGNMADRLPLLKRWHDVTGCNLMVLSYRGYGESTGAPSEKGLRIDCQTAFDYLLKRQQQKEDINDIFVYGHSVGGAAALHVTADNSKHVKGLILENTFTSLADLVVALYPQPYLLYRYFTWALWNKWDNVSAMKLLFQNTESKTDIMLISGTADELVPPSQMDSLNSLAQCSSPSNSRIVEFLKVPGGMHNTTMEMPYVMDSVASFIKRSQSQK